MRTAIRIARALPAIAIAGLSLVLTGGSVLTFGAEFGPTGAAYPVGWLAFALIGAFLGWKRPHNAVGWLFAVIGLTALLGLSAETPDGPGLRQFDAPEPVLAAVSGLWFVSFALLPALLILFPDGRAPSPRWRAVVGMIIVTVPIGTLSSGEDPARSAIGPAFVEAFGLETGRAMVGGLQGIASVGMMAFVALGAIAIGIRARRSRGAEREQLKWIAFAGALLAGTIVLTFIAFFSPLRALDPGAEYPVMMFGGIPFVVSLVSIPFSAAVAIQRYRLYDIDVLINRALVYGALTATLGAAYVASVLALQAILRPFTTGSDIAVAASTLAVVALFQPLRRRIHDIVDRRFYRSRYDAARTLDAFGTRLRNEVDLDDVRTDLIGIVHASVRPAHASLWLRERAK